MKDWLDSDEFKKWLNGSHDFTWNQKGAEQHLWVLLRKIREHFVPKPQWIKITKDPRTWPPIGNEILVCDSVGFIRVDCRNEWKQIGDDCASAFDNSAFYEQPIAWMPIPNPPEAEIWEQHHGFGDGSDGEVVIGSTDELMKSKFYTCK